MNRLSTTNDVLATRTAKLIVRLTRVVSGKEASTAEIVNGNRKVWDENAVELFDFSYLTSAIYDLERGGLENAIHDFYVGELKLAKLVAKLNWKYRTWSQAAHDLKEEKLPSPESIEDQMDLPRPN